MYESFPMKRRHPPAKTEARRVTASGGAGRKLLAFFKFNIQR